MKIFRKVTYISLVSCLLLTLALNLVPTKAYAASELEQRIKDRLNLEAFKKCVDGGNTTAKIPAPVNITGLPFNPIPIPTSVPVSPNGGLSETVEKGKSPIGYYAGVPLADQLPGEGPNKDFVYLPSEMEVSVGYLIDSDNGQWQCGIRSHADVWFKLIGYSSLSDFLSKEYNNNDNYTIKSKVSQNAIRAKVKGKIDDAIGKLPLRDQHRYLIYYKSFEKCADIGSASKNQADISGPSVNVEDFVKIDGTVTEGRTYFRITEANEIAVGHGFGPADGRLTCSELAQKLTDLAPAFASWASDNSEEIAAIAASGSASGDDSSCEANTGVMAWIGCPLIEIIGGALNWVDTQVSRLLEVDASKVGGDSMYVAWTRFRNLGLSLLIVAMLVMVISTALGLSVLDAYTVKKAFPKLIIAIIFTLLSWWICIFLIDLFNALGKGILGLMSQPFGIQGDGITALFNPSAASGGLQIVGLGLGAAALALPGALGIVASWIGAALLVMGIAFITLVARQMFIVVLVLFSPIAILAWIFPNTEKAWKFWWGTFSKLLLMYPMVMALIGAGRIFAAVIATTPSAGGEGLLNPLLKLTAYVLPYLFIPFTFKAAGGVFGNLAGMVNDRSKGAFDRLRKGRQKNYKRIGDHAITKRADLARTINKRASTSTGRGRSAFLRGAGRLASTGNVSARLAAINKEQGQIIGDQIATGPDDNIRGSTVALSALKDFEASKAAGLAKLSSTGERLYKTLGGGWVNEAAVREGHARFKTQSQQQAALSYEMRKATTDEQVEGLVERYSALRDDYGLTKQQADGMWIGAAFENQGQHLSLKHTSFDENGDAQLNAAGLASEAYEKKGSYQLSQMSGFTMNQLMTGFDDAKQGELQAAVKASQAAARGDTEAQNAALEEAAKHQRTQKEIQGVAETFMSRYGAGGSGQQGETPDGTPVIPAAQPGGPGQREQVYQTNAPGAAAVAERVRKLAVHTGVYVPELPTPRTVSPPPGPNIDLQH